MSVRKSDNAELYAKVEEQNLLRQYDLLLNCIEIGLTKGIEAFDKYIYGPSTLRQWQISLNSGDVTGRSRSM